MLRLAHHLAFCGLKIIPRREVIMSTRSAQGIELCLFFTYMSSMRLEMLNDFMKMKNRIIEKNIIGPKSGRYSIADAELNFKLQVVNQSLSKLQPPSMY